MRSPARPTPSPHPATTTAHAAARAAAGAKVVGTVKTDFYARHLSAH
jgi:hypothetical protein